MRDWLESKAYADAKEVIMREINHPRFRMVIDYKCFKHSKEEKAQIATMKLQNREERKKHYGKDANKYLNIPSRSINNGKPLKPLH